MFTCILPNKKNPPTHIHVLTPGFEALEVHRSLHNPYWVLIVALFSKVAPTPNLVLLFPWMCLDFYSICTYPFKNSFIDHVLFFFFYYVLLSMFLTSSLLLSLWETQRFTEIHLL